MDYLEYVIYIIMGLAVYLGASGRQKKIRADAEDINNEVLRYVLARYKKMEEEFTASTNRLTAMQEELYSKETKLQSALHVAQQVEDLITRVTALDTENRQLRSKLSILTQQVGGLKQERDVAIAEKLGLLRGYEVLEKLAILTSNLDTNVLQKAVQVILEEHLSE